MALQRLLGCGCAQLLGIHQAPSLNTQSNTGVATFGAATNCLNNYRISFIMSRSQRFFYDVRQYAVLLDEDDHFLTLQLPDKYKDLAKKWTLPGGKLEPKDDPEGGLLREIKEETSLKADILFPFHIARWKTKNSEKLGVFYLCRLTGRRHEPKLSHEHQNYLWLSGDKAAKHPFYNKVFKQAIRKAYEILEDE